MRVRADAQDLIIILRLTGLGRRMRRQCGARQYDADETSKMLKDLRDAVNCAARRSCVESS
jgi:hypothetical protein